MSSSLEALPAHSSRPPVGHGNGRHPRPMSPLDPRSVRPLKCLDPPICPGIPDDSGTGKNPVYPAGEGEGPLGLGRGFRHRDVIRDPGTAFGSDPLDWGVDETGSVADLYYCEGAGSIPLHWRKDLWLLATARPRQLPGSPAAQRSKVPGTNDGWAVSPFSGVPLSGLRPARRTSGGAFVLWAEQ